MFIFIIFKLYKVYSFEEIILSEYKNKNFNRLKIEKELDNDKRELRRCNDINKINDLLSYLKNLELSNRPSTSKNELEHEYFIRLYNDETHENLYIFVDNKNSLGISRVLTVIEETESFKSLDTKMDHKEYTIVNSNLNMDYIEELYNSCVPYE